MSKSLLALVLTATALTHAATAVAHHSYGQYDRCKKISLEGTVESVAWENPHVLLMLATSAGTYRVEWQTLTQLQRAGVVQATFNAGDRLVVTGSVNRDPETKTMTLVTEVRRPEDSWRWRDTRPPAAQCAAQS
jgi:Family of unknown function (DUF6152)